MTSVISPAGLINLEAPLPTPRTDDLLAVSGVVQHEDDGHWLGGAWSEGFPPGPGFTHDPCSTGTERVKEVGGEIGQQQTRRFTVYQPAVCTAQSIALEIERWLAKLDSAFRIYEGAAVERTLATGDGHADLGPFLGDENMELLAAGAVNPLSALRLLENAIALNGSGIIHAAPSTVVVWDALNLTVIRDGLTYTKRGTPIAVGAGYIGTVPSDAAALEEGQQWAFASGPVEIHRAAFIDHPATSVAEAMDRSMNDIYLLAERSYVFNWIGRQGGDDRGHTQAGVLVDEASTFALAVVDGGSCDT